MVDPKEENNSNEEPKQEELTAQDAPATEEPVKQDKFDPGKLVMTDEEASPTQAKSYNKRNWGKLIRNTLVVILILAALGAGVFAGYNYFLKDKGGQDEATQTADNAQPEQSDSSAQASELSETYDSALLRLSFMYPSDWTVNEADRGITVQSPAFTYTTSDGEEVEGGFKIYIRKGARSVDGNYLGKGAAIKESEQIIYTEPVEGQRDKTYLSVFGLDEPNNFAYFIVQGNIKLDKGDTLGPDFAKEPDAYLIFGGYTSEERQDDLATNTLPLDSYEQTAQYQTAVEIIKSLQLR